MTTEEVEMTEVVPPKKALTDIDVNDDDEDEETKKKRDMERSFWTKLWQGLAAASIAVNIAAMVIYGGVATIVMGVIACVVGAIVIKVQMDLQDTDCESSALCCVQQSGANKCCAHVLLCCYASSPTALRRLQNMLRHEVNRLQEENSKLHESVNELETKVTAYVIVVHQISLRSMLDLYRELTFFPFCNRLKGSEEKLTAITSEQGTNVDQLVGLVRENQEILDEMKVSCNVKISFQHQYIVTLSPLACCE
jgi:hypothetical protein